MPTILAIETSSEIAQAALWHAGNCYVRHATGVQNHSMHILPMVQELLQQAKLTLADCEAIAYGAGPGSFTGVRTACGIAQGLGFAAKLPLLAMNTLASMAQECLAHIDGASPCDILVVLDARMGQVYWAQYRWLGEAAKALNSATAWQEIQAPSLSDPAEVRAIGQVYICGNGLDAFEVSAFSELAQQNAQALPPRLLQVQLPSASAMAYLAQASFANGEGIPAEQAQPLYLRNKIAYTSAERAAGMQPRSGT